MITRCIAAWTLAPHLTFDYLMLGSDERMDNVDRIGP